MVCVCERELLQVFPKYGNNPTYDAISTSKSFSAFEFNEIRQNQNQILLIEIFLHLQNVDTKIFPS